MKPLDGMKPLEGLTVVELSRGASGLRYAGRLLAQLGATVYRPGAAAGAGPGADDHAGADGDAPEPGYGGEAGRAYALWLDQDKIASAPAGRVDLALVERDETVEADLVADLRWFEPDGPYARWRGSNAVIQALCGVAFAFGPADGGPTLPQGDAAQVLAGATLCIAALAALIGRRAGGGPSRVSSSVFESALCITETAPLAFAKGGPPARRRGLGRFFPTYPQTNWKAADGWIGATALTPPQWVALCRLIGLESLLDDETLMVSEERFARADEVDAAITPVVATLSAQYLEEAGQKARVPLAATQRPADTVRDPHWAARGSFQPLPAPFASVQGPRAPYRIRRGAAWTPRSADRDAPTPERPLAGLRVIDFSMGWSGPLATRHLGDLGADVIKIESPTHMDWWRGWDGGEAGDPPPREIRPAFVGMNRNKRGVALDFAKAEDVAVARGLIEGADLVIDNFAPGVMAKLGFGPDALQEIAPGIVVVGMGAFGAEGPKSGYRGYGSTVEQASGLCFMNGAEDWPPVMQHVAYGDAVAGLFAAVGGLACLWGRPRQGGAIVDLAQVECLFQIAAPATIAEQVSGRPVPRAQAGRPVAAPAGVVRATGEAKGEADTAADTDTDSDSWIAFEVEDAPAWSGLCRLLGRSDWDDDPALATPSGRKAREPDILAAVADWARNLEPDTAAALLQEAGVPAGVVRPAHQLTEDRQLQASEFWSWADRRHIGRHLLAAAPYRLDGARPALRRVAPTLGEHDAEVLSPYRAAAAAGEGVR